MAEYLIGAVFLSFTHSFMNIFLTNTCSSSSVKITTPQKTQTYICVCNIYIYNFLGPHRKAIKSDHNFDKKTFIGQVIQICNTKFLLNIQKYIFNIHLSSRFISPGVVVDVGDTCAPLKLLTGCRKKHVHKQILKQNT